MLIALVAIGCLFTACKKSDSGGGGNGGSAVLTSGKWKIISSSSVIDYPVIGKQTVDAFSTIQDCQKDNLYIFNTDNTTTTDEGLTKCNSSDPQSYVSGTYSLSSDSKTLVVTASGRTVTSDVLTLSSSSMILKYATNDNNIDVVTTTTYSHQ